MCEIGIGEVSGFFIIMLLTIMVGILFSSYLDLFFNPNNEFRKYKRENRKIKKSKR